MPSNTAIYVYIAVTIIIIGVLSGFLYNCNKKSCQPYTPPRDMCLCDGMGGKLCANRQELINSYDKGNTESQDLADIQKKAGGPFWRNTDFSCY